MKSHAFIDSHSHEYDSNCAVCGGKMRDYCHGIYKGSGYPEAFQRVGDIQPEQTTRNTEQDFRNAGYSPERAQKLSQDPAFNWKAANGGKRKEP